MTPDTRHPTHQLPQWAIVLIALASLAFLNIGAPLLAAAVTAGIQ